MTTEAAPSPKSSGLGPWMQRVIEECDKVVQSFSPDPVHDLRVALRRCRSIADGLMGIDPDPSWKKMKKAGKQLFRALGELRDLHVMEEWISRLGLADDAAGTALRAHASSRENTVKAEAARDLQLFDRKQWIEWSESLPSRTGRIPANGLVFQQLALERWQQAHNLHLRALRNRTKTGWHQLRIGLKKFRYHVENFLPQFHQSWGDDLKKLQDALGEIHDLDILWTTALQIKAFPDVDTRVRWHAAIEQERNQRIEKYRERMVGRQSLWRTWRAELPQGPDIERAAMEKLRVWASFLDPAFTEAKRVSKLALQLYDGLAGNGHSRPKSGPRTRSILQAAALMHDVGRSKRDKKYQKVSYQLIRRLSPPFAWKPEDLQIAALVARYHRGALPRPEHKGFAQLTQGQRRQTVVLAGILRLVKAVDRQFNGSVRSLEVEETPNFITVWAEGTLHSGKPSERIAAARYLLETTFGQPILIRPRVPATAGDSGRIHRQKPGRQAA